MRVNPNSEPFGLSSVSSRKAVRQPRLEQDEVAVTQAEALSRALEQTPAVRAEKVARAKSLVQDTHYPPAVMVRKIATLLASALAKPEDFPISTETQSEYIGEPFRRER